ncbi:MAG: hypothetical protein ACXAEN_21445 [Candidatus Thorarchaeota archaeon]|jgi:hypothetical protein
MGEHYSCDNSGNRVPAHPYCADPEPASGITLTITTAGEDYTQTLEGGKMYCITYVASAGKFLLMSASGVTSTAANIEWVIHSRFPYLFRMPLGKTTLYFEGDDSATKAYIRELKNN